MSTASDVDTPETSVLGPRDGLFEMARSLYSIAHREGMRIDIAIESFATALDLCPDLDVTEFLKERCDIDPEKFRALVEASQADDLEQEARRVQVIKALRGRIAPAAGHGGDRRGEQVSDTNLNLRDADAAAIIARLKRDDPDLAQQIINGDISANAAAIRAGIRKAYARVRTDDCTRAVTVLLRHYSPDEIRAALP